MEKHKQVYPITEQARHLSTPLRVSGATPVTQRLLSSQVEDGRSMKYLIATQPGVDDARRAKTKLFMSVLLAF